MRFKEFLILIVIILSLEGVSAAHFVVGVVNDARDGTFSNDRVVVIWNTLYGIDDNLTDIIGPNGNSGSDNIYMFDCELLGNGCDIGDKLSVRVINESNDYITYSVNVTVTGAGFDIADNLTLNSPPNSSLNYPENNGNSSSNITFNCSYSDLDSNVKNISLFGNWSIGWHLNETVEVSGNGTVEFSKTLDQGTYLWNCLVIDDLNQERFAENNRTFNIDSTPPNISSVLFNESHGCGTTGLVRVNCTVVDDFSGVDTVIIEAISPSWKVNYTASILSGDTYYSDVLINETGGWIFNCHANDSVGNTNLSSDLFTTYSGSAELRVLSSYLNFSSYSPLENEVIEISSIVENLGCGDADNFLAGFYNGDPDSGGDQINGNITTTVLGLSNGSINVSWAAEIGTTNVYVDLDVSDMYIEDNESNNKANITINVSGWQEFYGNVSVDKVLAGYNYTNLSLWSNATNLTGNVFISDIESNVDWLSLVAIGKNSTNGSSTNDLVEIDNLLNMSNFEDPVSLIFGSSSTETFIVHQRIIEDVPIINSTNNSNFQTGILWDSSDDVGDGEFSEEDAEDIVFVAKINNDKQGKYGVYDYELNIPVRLREYNSTDVSDVYLYYDLV